LTVAVLAIESVEMKVAEKVEMTVEMKDLMGCLSVDLKGVKRVYLTADESAD
jgi:hypothetical protein